MSYTITRKLDGQHLARFQIVYEEVLQPVRLLKPARSDLEQRVARLEAWACPRAYQNSLFSRCFTIAFDP